jgi:hypothetical protein
MLPVLFLHHFQYISGYYYWQISYTNLPGSLLAGLVIYYIPMTGIGVVYFYILYYMKKVKSQLILQNHRYPNQRDLIVLHRIII